MKKSFAKTDKQHRVVAVRKPKQPQSDDTQSEHANTILLEGQIAVQAALQASSRRIDQIIISSKRSRKSRHPNQRANQRDQAIRAIEQLAQQAEIPVEHLNESAFQGYLQKHSDDQKQGSTHGGIVALAGPRHFVPLDSLIKPDQTPFIVMLDGIEDPFNFGHTVRALYAAGMTGLVVRSRNWMTAANVVIRASAGATEYVETAIAGSVESAVATFRKHGCHIACTGMGEDARVTSFYEANLTQPLFLLIGGEKRGITRSFMEQADSLLQIPYNNPFDYSLGTTAAAAVLGFEVMRQRREHDVQ